MRKSQAPSVLKQKALAQPEANGAANGSACGGVKVGYNGSSSSSSSRRGKDDDMVVERMPMFDFLSIPDDLKKKFSVPKGCVITSESIRLRSIKTLGGNKRFPILVPGGLKSFVVPRDMAPAELDDGDDGAEDLPTANLPPFVPLVLWTDPSAAASTALANDGDVEIDDSLEKSDCENIPPALHKIEVVPQLASKLRDHQREGVQFLFDCTMGLRGFVGQGCILADDMGLGKTLMSITLIWTLMNQGFVKGQPAVRKVCVVCPVSLVGNWDNEIKRWVGDACATYPVKADAKRDIKNYLSAKKGVLIISYEQMRLNQNLFKPSKFASAAPVCELLVCDEAHKLKNSESGIAKALNALPAKKRVLLSGTPMQNDLGEFFNMVDFCNEGVVGTPAYFKKHYERPILLSRELDASEADKKRGSALQKELSTIVNEFILRRGNSLNAKHLPPKLVQYVCCRPSDEQMQMYDLLIAAKNENHLLAGKQEDTLSYIRYFIRMCCHPKLIYDTYAESCKRGAPIEMLEPAARVHNSMLPQPVVRDDANRRENKAAVSKGQTPAKGVKAVGGGIGSSDFFDPAKSGKLTVLYRMMQTMRAEKNGERIVVVSNYTNVLEMIKAVCEASKWPCIMLDGSVTGANRTKMVDKFNDPMGNIFAFLLSSKAGGCGINLIGGNRLVLFDADWNPANDKQAAGRIWREGQQKRCYIYRFVTTGTIEEKIVQRQLAKENLQNVITDTDPFAEFSSAELKNLFQRADETPSDTHDTLRCARCKSVRAVDTLSDIEAKKRLNADQKALCIELIEELTQFCVEATEANPLNATDQGASFEFPRQDLDSLLTQLLGQQFATLPLFSKKLRDVIKAMDIEQQDQAQAAPSMRSIGLLPPHVSLLDEFLRRWGDAVPRLAELQTKRAPSAQAAAKAGAGGAAGPEGIDDVEEDSGFVEQEGCPDDTDLKKWSHHTSVHTCDDPLLRRAMGDDDSVTFVFGCEVTWDLIQQREMDEREEMELRKEKARQDLAELNERRAVERQAKADVEAAAAEKLARRKAAAAAASAAAAAAAAGGEDSTVVEAGAVFDVESDGDIDSADGAPKADKKGGSKRPRGSGTKAQATKTAKPKPQLSRGRGKDHVDDDDEEDESQVWAGLSNEGEGEGEVKVNEGDTGLVLSSPPPPARPAKKSKVVEVAAAKKSKAVGGEDDDAGVLESMWGADEDDADDFEVVVKPKDRNRDRGKGKDKSKSKDKDKSGKDRSRATEPKVGPVSISLVVDSEDEDGMVWKGELGTAKLQSKGPTLSRLQKKSRPAPPSEDEDDLQDWDEMPVASVRAVPIPVPLKSLHQPKSEPKPKPNQASSEPPVQSRARTHNLQPDMVCDDGERAGDEALPIGFSTHLQPQQQAQRQSQSSADSKFNARTQTRDSLEGLAPPIGQAQSRKKSKKAVDSDDDGDGAREMAETSVPLARSSPQSASVSVSASASAAADASGATAAAIALLPTRHEDGSWDCLLCSYTNPPEYDTTCGCCMQKSGFPKARPSRGSGAGGGRR